MSARPASAATGQLLATDAHEMSHHQEGDRCAHCGHTMVAGQRICRLLDGRWIHTSCIAKVA